MTGASDAVSASGDDVSTQPGLEPDIVVLSGSPDADELAAVTAVLAGILDELAEEQGRRALSSQSAWGRSQRGVRGPLHAGPGLWRGFSA